MLQIIHSSWLRMLSELSRRILEALRLRLQILADRKLGSERPRIHMVEPLLISYSAGRAGLNLKFLAMRS
ncbi:hypothetical protein CPT32_29030 [Rhizobium sophoriradicis]|nr:hypothetical protein CPT32_29030 [Rhizobium sophoriradicis]